MFDKIIHYAKTGLNRQRCDTVRRQLITLLIIVAIVVMIYHFIIIPKYYSTHYDSFTERFSSTPYERELSLYKSLSNSAKEQYLNMSRGEKLAKYKNQLM